RQLQGLAEQRHGPGGVALRDADQAELLDGGDVTGLPRSPGLGEGVGGPAERRLGPVEVAPGRLVAPQLHRGVAVRSAGLAPAGPADLGLLAQQPFGVGGLPQAETELGQDVEAADVVIALLADGRGLDLRGLPDQSLGAGEATRVAVEY